MQTINQQLEVYKDYLRIQNFSKRTVKSYLLWLRHFLQFREDHNLGGVLTQEQARRFMMFKHDQGLSWSAINVLYSSLRKYYKEVMELEWYVKKLPRPRSCKVLPTK